MKKNAKLAPSQTQMCIRDRVYIGQGVLKSVRDDMFEHMQTLPIRYFDQNTNGSVMSR